MIQTISADEVKRRAAALGADLCGIAPVDRFVDAPAGFHPTAVLGGCRSVIVIAQQFPASVFASPSAAAYTFAMFKAADQVDTAAFRIASELDRLGSRAIAVPSREPYEYWDEGRRHGQGILSLKHAAVRAGLGRMGKNTLLVNDKFGNLLCLGAVLVDRELAADRPAEYLTCEPDCRICLDACPAKALDGASIEQRKCRSVCGRYSEGGGFIYACNLCRRSCPHHRGLKTLLEREKA
ncbi:hypothetical protein [Anaeroselena agilis]|uniref:Epoxyqueuosine reductase n=1 Tax=Anaeroselena agilis TaxID=3063788 RepID=A0ABU3NT30_9FIRM|nr:hypothetical protein [Selenomonadales bacterium 4137-cl]